MADDLERLAAEKAAVTALRGSTKAIETVLERNRVLESALRSAGNDLRSAKKFVGESAYIIAAGDRQKRIVDLLEEQAQAALKLVS